VGLLDDTNPVTSNPLMDGIRGILLAAVVHNNNLKTRPVRLFCQGSETLI